MPDEIKTEMNYNLEELDNESLAYINRLFAKRYKQWKSDLHHHFQAFDDPQVALQEGCPKELEGRGDSWAWLYAHFQGPDYVAIMFMQLLNHVCQQMWIVSACVTKSISSRKVILIRTNFSATENSSRTIRRSKSVKKDFARPSFCIGRAKLSDG
ncbi:unnamed protein product [Prunus armeniaca]